LLDRHFQHFIAVVFPEAQKRHAQMIMQSGRVEDLLFSQFGSFARLALKCRTE
jgi:hypothetical protein